MTLETARLRLVPYAPADLLALVESEAQFGGAFGQPAAAGLREFVVGPEVAPEWLAQLRAAATADVWRHGFAVVHVAGGLVIGTVGFKGPPDDEASVEIGYGIVPAFNGQGYATEAAAAGVGFAFADPRVRRVLAHTMPQQNASTRVLQKCRFDCVGEINDPEDGVVWRWQRWRSDGDRVGE
ncbi:MAG: GNAT family N-acetyltransferase [Planctomycetota bacterium]